MAILFRPYLAVDQTHWIPILSAELKDFDFRVWPDVGDPADILYYMGWEVFDGDHNAYPNLKAFLSFKAGIERYIGNPNFPKNAKLIRMIDPGLTESMVEYVLSYVMRLHREHDQMPAYLDGKWGSIVPKRAHQRKIGLMGLGHIGQAAAKALVQSGFHVKGWSRSEKNISGVECFAGNEALTPFLQDLDVLVCLLPLTPQTENILSDTLFRRLPQGAAIINIARGKHIVDEDLVNAIETNHLSYAVLDVFRKEPLPRDHIFYKTERILLTPHIAGITAPDTAVPVLKQTLTDLENDRVPDGLVDIDRGY